MRKSNIRKYKSEMIVKWEKNSLTFLLFILACAGSTHIMAQPNTDFKSVARNMKKQYENVARLHVVMTVKVFDAPSSTTPYFQSTAEVKRDKENYLSRFDTNDMLINEKYIVMVDRGEKHIMYSRRNKKAAAAFQDPVLTNIDSILSAYGTPAYVETINGLEHFRLIQPQNIIRQLDLFINTQTNTFQKIEYHYLEGQSATIEFKTFNILPVFAAGTFDEKQYVLETKGKFKAAPEFQHYSTAEIEEAEQ